MRKMSARVSAAMGTWAVGIRSECKGVVVGGERHPEWGLQQDKQGTGFSSGPSLKWSVDHFLQTYSPLPLGRTVGKSVPE